MSIDLVASRQRLEECLDQIQASFNMVDLVARRQRLEECLDQMIQASPNMVVLDAISQRFKEYAHQIQANPNSDGWIRLVDLLGKAQNDKRIQSSPGASDFLDLMIVLAEDSLTASTADRAVQPLIDVSDEAVFAKPFLKHAGRERNPGPVRAFIRAVLKKKPAAKNKELWDAIMARPPKDWKAMETRSFGRYLEGPKPSDEVKWKSFCTYASSERKRLKIHS